jgi:pentalenene oxygenase
MPGYAARMSEQIDKALGGWRDGQIIDVSLDMYRIATGVLFATLFDANPPVRVLDQVASDVTTVYDSITKRALMPASLATLTPGNRRYQHARGRLRRLASEILADRRADGNDLPAMLLAASGEADVGSRNEPDRLTEAELVSNMVLFLLAGTGTTANLLIWALHLLAQHPEFQHRLQSEVDTVLAGTPATLADLPNLPLTGQLINEALRLYPTGWIFSRTAATDTHLGGHPIPAGTTLIWSAYVIHHRADLYPDPERFNPERWASPDSNLRAADATYLPFATGPHYCIGQSFALAEAGLALTAVVSRWELEPFCGTPVEPRPGQILRANHLKLGVTARRPTLTSAGPSRGPSTGQQCPYHEPPG